MNRVIKILMQRDEMTKDEAMELINDVKEAMMDCIESGNYMEAEDIFTSELGLEPDYIIDLF